MEETVVTVTSFEADPPYNVHGWPEFTHTDHIKTVNVKQTNKQKNPPTLMRSLT